jgi:hypothetical protein
MKNQEEIDDDENRINRQLDYKRSQAFGSLFFHRTEIGGALNRLIAGSADLLRLPRIER